VVIKFTRHKSNIRALHLECKSDLNELKLLIHRVTGNSKFGGRSTFKGPLFKDVRVKFFNVDFFSETFTTVR